MRDKVISHAQVQIYRIVPNVT
uniref:Uncharacterized protein n=1 Tax=Anopheles albimanus TaxID=7167 RepID=A0A182FXK5_ANOAL